MPESPVASVEQLPAAVVVHILSRELQQSDTDGLCSAIDKAVAGAPSLPFILDMANVEFAGSMAMGVLVGLNQEFRTRGQRLIFVNLRPAISQALNITRINRVLEMMPDVRMALRAMGAAT